MCLPQFFLSLVELTGLALDVSSALAGKKTVVITIANKIFAICFIQ